MLPFCPSTLRIHRIATQGKETNFSFNVGLHELKHHGLKLYRKKVNMSSIGMLFELKSPRSFTIYKFALGIQQMRLQNAAS